MSTTQVQTPEIDIDKVDVSKDFNSRTHFDKAELEAMAASIERVGVINPIKVVPGKAGHVELVAGERRLRAAMLARLKKIPYTFARGNGRDEAFFENHSRADLTPIETACDIEALAEEHNLTSNAEIAAFINPSKPKLRLKWVGEHRRLLALPKEVQRYFAAKDVPISAEPKLREIAKVSPKIATLICEVAKKNEVSGQLFNSRFGDLLETVGGNADELGVTMIKVSGFRLSEVIEDEEKRKTLTDRINPMLMEYQRSDDPRFQFTGSEVDAARAAGCLVEYHSNGNGYNAFNTYVIDRSVAEDLIERAVETAETEVEAAKVRAAEEKVKAKDERKKARDQRKESGEETPQAIAKKRKLIARKFNDALKRTLLKKRTPARRKKYRLARKKAIAVQLISDNPDLAAAGLRLVSAQMQEVEVKPLKKGGNREIVTYAPRNECNAELLRRVMAAKDADEVDEIVAEALIAGLLADREEFPSKDHVGWYTPVASDLERLMATEIKEVRPRRIPKPKL